MNTTTTRMELQERQGASLALPSSAESFKLKDVIIPEKKKIRLAWFSNHFSLPTGFSRVTRSVCERLAMDPLFEVHLIAEGSLEKGDAKWHNCTLWGAGNDMNKFMERTAQIVSTIKADVLIFLEDTFTLGNFGFQYIKWPCTVGIYCPMDGKGVPDMGLEVLRNMDFIIPMSNYTKFVCEREEFECENVIHHGVNLNDFCPVSKEKQAELKIKYGFEPTNFIIFNMARNSARKNTQTLIQSLYKFLENKPENVKALLHIMNPDMKESNLYSFTERFMSAETGKNLLGTRIIINSKGSNPNNPLSDSEVAELYQLSDVIVSAALGEGSGLIQHEGMACAKPIVHCAYSTPMEILDDESCGIGKRGITVPSKIDIVSSYNVEHGFVDANDFAEGINRVYYDKELADTLGKNGRDFAERFFDWDYLVFNQWIPTIKRNI